MFGLMWNIYWRFLPRHNRSAAQKNPVNKICLLFAFSVPTERAAIATGNDLRGLGICHQQAFSRNSGNGISAKYAILRKIALLAGFSYPVFLPFRAVFLQMRKEDAYTPSFSSSASFNLMAPSMTPYTMGRYFSGQSCNLWLVRWRCSLSSRSSSGLK